jgi:hypothetical protein
MRGGWSRATFDGVHAAFVNPSPDPRYHGPSSAKHWNYLLFQRAKADSHRLMFTILN